MQQNLTSCIIFTLYSAVEEFKTTAVNEEIWEELEATLEEQFGKTWPDIRFAVRSSALGKD